MHQHQNYPCYGCVVPESDIPEIVKKICVEKNISMDYYEKNLSSCENMADKARLASSLLKHNLNEGEELFFLCNKIPDSYDPEDFGVPKYSTEGYFFVGFADKPLATEPSEERTYSPDWHAFKEQMGKAYEKLENAFRDHLQEFLPYETGEFFFCPTCSCCT